MGKINSIVLLCIVATIVVYLISCTTVVAPDSKASNSSTVDTTSFIKVDTTKIPNDKFGQMVNYGRQLMLNTAYYIGPDGVNGKYLGNKMNCTNCHQEAGTKPFSFNLMASHDHYPQYRAREGHVLTLAERVNNCVMHPHNGKPLPLDSKEMVAFLCYLKWINSFVPKNTEFKGQKNLTVAFPDVAANPEHGKEIYLTACARCHGNDGQGQMDFNNITYTYPPLWGLKAYQPGSSMHRVIKSSQWIKANMPYDKSKWNQPLLSDQEALDVAAFINDDAIHVRPTVKNYDYPYPEEKAIDYDIAPFIDSFSASQHKNGPFLPIITAWKNKGLKPSY